MNSIPKSFLLGGLAMTIAFLIVFISKNLQNNSFNLVSVRVAGRDINVT